MNLFREVLAGFDRFVLVYFLVLNGLYLVLAVLATIDVLRTARWAGIAGQDDLFAYPLTPGISVIVPARNEEGSILACAQGVLSLRYPELELIIVDDGSTDGTFALIDDAYALVEIRRSVGAVVPVVGTVRSVHLARTGTPVVVVRKDHGGRRRRPQRRNERRHEATRLLPGRRLEPGQGRAPQCGQAVRRRPRPRRGGWRSRPRRERMRLRIRTDHPPGNAELLDREDPGHRVPPFVSPRGTAWSRLGSLMIISGAFGLFQLETVIEVGGLDVDSIAEDFELVTRLHHRLRTRRGHYRIVSVPEPAAWTEVPATIRSLASQRRRWARGLAETLVKHRRMTGSPRYGMVGVVALPYYLAFECLGRWWSSRDCWRSGSASRWVSSTRSSPSSSLPSRSPMPCVSRLPP